MMRWMIGESHNTVRGARYTVTRNSTQRPADRLLNSLPSSSLAHRTVSSRHAEPRPSDPSHLASSLAGRIRRRLPVRHLGCPGVRPEAAGNLWETGRGRTAAHGDVG